MSEPVRLYFHFRSPYSWLATERLMLKPIPLDAVPLSGVPKSMTQQPGQPNPRLDYVVQDVIRIAGKMQLKLGFPDPFDTDWSRVSAGFWAAREAGRPLEFMHAAFRARWSEGQDLGEADVMRAAARTAGVDPDTVVAAMDDPAIHKTLESFGPDLVRDGVCGVPFFVYRGQKFWGQDRVGDLYEAMGL